MRYDLKEFDFLVEKGFLRKVEKDDMVLYNYTDECTFEREWNQYTMLSRGLILQKTTGEVIAKPFPKFFNLGEMEEMSLPKLPVDKGYHVFEKMDGSLGILFFWGGQWQMATRGSFESEQALMGRDMLSKYRMRYLDKDFTYLVEIIYPENKIVVDYGNEHKLVLLSAYHTRTEKEVNPEIIGYLAQQLGMESAMLMPYSIEEMIELQKIIPKDMEGFVVRFTNGLRVKIKGDEYLKIHKMISCMTPLSFWENMKQGVVNRQYLAQLPEEFRKDFTPIVSDLEGYYNMITKEILEDFMKLPTQTLESKEDARAIGLFMRDNRGVIKHPGAMWPLLNQKWTVTDDYIMKKIRPKGNVLRAA